MRLPVLLRAAVAVIPVLVVGCVTMAPLTAHAGDAVTAADESEACASADLLFLLDTSNSITNQV